MGGVYGDVSAEDSEGIFGSLPLGEGGFSVKIATLSSCAACGNFEKTDEGS
jgi:hypothetical protein